MQSLAINCFQILNFLTDIPGIVLWCRVHIFWKRGEQYYRHNKQP